ncbi:MAG: CoA transferase [Actinomycetia bacterium]|nr:CoA transferase [Actinomycetes bacterium]
MTLPGILDGIKVIEFAQNAAVPECGRILAGMGADVVKVEPPEGDAMRRMATLAPHESKAYALINPGKRAMILDLKSPRAREVSDALLGWADVVLTGFKQSDLARYGIDWDHARTVNPRLIHLTHTPFGPNGPDANEGGYDVLVQGLSGQGFIMNRSENGVPMPTRPAVNDFGTGVCSALGVVAALRHRDLTGDGQRVDTALLATALTLSTPMISYFEAVDRDPVAEAQHDLAALRDAGADFDVQRELYESRVQAGQGSFRLYFRHYQTADGLLSVGGLSKGLLAKFHEATGIPRPTSVIDHTSAELDAIVEQAEHTFASRTTDEWLAILRAVGYPCQRYNSPMDAVHDPQIRANDFIVDLEHPAFGSYSAVGMPVQFSQSPASVRGPSPGFGEHTRAVLAQAGLEPGIIESLLDEGTIGAGD